MLTRSVGAKWAQIGWLEAFEDERHTFVQYTTPEYDPDDPAGTLETWFFAPEPVGVFSEYRVEYTGSLFTYWAGSSPVASSLAYFTPNKGAISGEIINLQSQMPGGVNSPEVFQLSYILTGGWVPFNGTMYVTPGYGGEFGGFKFSSYQAWVWDRRCDS
jgi:hypothetical protein